LSKESIRYAVPVHFTRPRTVPDIRFPEPTNPDRVTKGMNLAYEHHPRRTRNAPRPFHVTITGFQG
ncbi:MAG TPA: hypothetical protein VK968_01855, partial [Roseimicrobium sp.]|nr:hypothetical protein [Roseimicrobium sp.]